MLDWQRQGRLGQKEWGPKPGEFKVQRNDRGRDLHKTGLALGFRMSLYVLSSELWGRAQRSW